MRLADRLTGWLYYHLHSTADEQPSGSSDEEHPGSETLSHLAAKFEAAVFGECAGRAAKGGEGGGG